MVAKDDMMGVLLDACPTFRPTWEASLAEWADSDSDLPHYLALAKFARHLIGMLERSETKSLPVIFRAVERLVTEGEHCVQEAAVVGLLEDLQNLNLYKHGTDPMQFKPFLGPQSAIAWDKLNKFWQQVGIMKAADLLGPHSGSTRQVNPDTIQDPELRRMVQHLYRKVDRTSSSEG